ncbi:tRNA pseudouridine(38-40) synthase TruA [Nocardioides sp. GY 10113]|uniref:tRNA pseudouridine(38-40) synthase TruA n=1 Tax=Nocardioides sp. GY 10113 TaxID=2569761 RepID=UPI0010A8E5BD|nr:tRNA pseudouridine(38-40) synthase TruA [Nocardioides sp. GY 10113]TIC86315.1 tRNA pseudouridine(38-40) synthase TruA [Nocardioides sp. GY 10113]
MRIRIDLAYDGTDFKGWASQPALRTVQGELTAALHTVLRVPPGTLQVTCAGRTDSGVHARGQVAHCDLPPEVVERLPERLESVTRRLNGVLDPDLRIHAIRPAPEGFDARFAATWRRYAYRIADRPELVDPLRRRHVLTWPRALDLDAMNAAAEALLGLHDFAAFCKQREGATTIRTLQELRWSRDADGIAVGHVKADAFCHSMVRALVGCLIAVGEGRREPSWAGEILSGRRRDPQVVVVHAHGLTLEEVGYPDDADLADRVLLTSAKRTEEETHG